MHLSLAGHVVSCHCQQDLEAAAPLLAPLTISSSSSAAAGSTGSSSSVPSAAGTTAAAVMSQALVAEADRRLVEVLLVAAGRVPGAALPAAELLVGLSVGSGELLLKQLDVLLQVGGAGSSTL
jgi:hypothetical protein